MAPLDIEVQRLKQQVHAMWGLVLLQLHHSQQALFVPDAKEAREVNRLEKKVNAQELKIERHCEQIIALNTPVAIDLRFVLAVLKINSSLERVGDAAKAIARFARHYVLNPDAAFDQQLLAVSLLPEMSRQATDLLLLVQQAFEQEDSSLARRLFLEAKLLADHNVKAHATIADYIKDNPARVQQGLQMLLLVRKLDRIGDEAKNIAEEIIFYIEAQVLRHKSAKKRRGAADS